MTLTDKFWQFVSRRLPKHMVKRATLRDPALIDLWGSSRAVSGVSVTTDSSLKFSPVWGAVLLLGRDVAKLPIMISKIKRADNSRTPDRAHQAYKLLRIRPNGFQTPFNFKFKLMADAMLHGNAYAWLRRVSPGGQVTDILPLDPVATTIEYVDVERFFYKTRLQGVEREIPILPEDVLHLRGLTRDGIIGEATIDNARDAVGVGMAGQEYTGRFFSNNTNSSLVFEHPGEIDGDVADRLRQSIERKQAGLENSWKPWILEDGMVAKSIAASNQDAELPELAQMSIRDVANYFNIPASKLGDVSKVSFSSLEEDSRAYVDQAVDPWLCQWEEEVCLKLFSERERFGETRAAEFDRKRLTRANLTARGDFLSKMIQMGVVSRNEARQDLGMNSVDGGDDFLVPVNLQDPDEPPPEPAPPPVPPVPPEEEQDPPEDGEDNRETWSPDIAEIALQALEALCKRYKTQGDVPGFWKAWDRRLYPILGDPGTQVAGSMLRGANGDLDKLPARILLEFGYERT